VDDCKEQVWDSGRGEGGHRGCNKEDEGEERRKRKMEWVGSCSERLMRKWRGWTLPVSRIPGVMWRSLRVCVRREDKDLHDDAITYT
jgi:hypothetical protein